VLLFSDKTDTFSLKRVGKMGILDMFRKNLQRNQFVEQFISYNNNSRKQIQVSKKQQSEVLIEMNPAYTTYILYAIICRAKLKKNHRLVGYRPTKSTSIKDFFTFYLFSNLLFDNGSYRPFRIMWSMGVDKFIQPFYIRKHKNQALEIYKLICNLDKKHLIALKINEIEIGDIFYDWHLRTRKLDTVTINGNLFKKDFIEFVCTFYWWYEYFRTRKIDSVFISHSCSDMALPARIGLSFGSQVILASYGRMYKLSDEKKFSDLEFMDYDPKSKEQFGYEVDLVRSRKLLFETIQGRHLIDAHTFGSGYSGYLTQKIVSKSDQINVLIACACFSDPPHSYGDTIFPDPKEWLNFIGEFSKVSDYKFYAKAHPGFWESDKHHYNNFLREFPNIKEIPHGYSNMELFKQGINVVLTIHGTIAFEAAYQGILVVNASTISPHMNYNFSLSPRSIEDYSQILKKLPQLIVNWEINKHEVEHFFDIHHLRKSFHPLFGNKIPEFYQHIGGWSEQFLNPKVFDYWLNIQTKDELLGIEDRLINFLENNDYMLSNLNTK
jgi:hypothetical protein